MSRDALIGVLIVAIALNVLTGLVLLSIRRIRRISSEGYRTARQTLKDMSDER